MKFVVRKQQNRSVYHSALVSILAVFVAFACAGLLLALTGVDPVQAYRQIWQGAIGSVYSITEVLIKATPLLFAGLALSVAFRANYWNIGAEGQLVMGGFAATGVALFWAKSLPAPFVLPTMILASFVGGAVWSMVATVLKLLWNVNEIITTLMLNYIAILWIQFLYFDLWKNPQGFGFPGSAEFPRVAWLPQVLGRVHIGFILALVSALILWLIFTRSTWGYELRVIGGSTQAARYAGISLVKNFLLVAVVSGGLAGLAGLSEVAGVSHKLQNGLAVGYGYTAIIVAFLGKLKPGGIVLAALFLAGLRVGCEQLQVSTNLPAALSQVLQGIILLFVLAADVLSRYRLIVRSPDKSADVPVTRSEITPYGK